MEITIKVEKVTDVNAVVNAACKMPVDVTAGEGRFTVDAKSIMGMYSLDLSKPVKFSWDNNADEGKVNEFLEAVKPYRV